MRRIDCPRLSLLISLLAVGLVGCSDSGHADVPVDANTGMGTLIVSLTDAPACGYSQVNVTVSAVRVHRSSAADASAENWQQITVDPPRQIDLLSLQNGALDLLGRTNLPAGRYRQARLLLVSNRKGLPLANSLVEQSDASNTPVELIPPLAVQNGVKLALDLDVLPGQASSLVLDFDACRSVVPAGRRGKYLLRPQINPVVVLPGGKFEIAGDLGVAGAGAQVSAQVMDTSGQARVLKSTVADAQGLYVLSPLPLNERRLVNLVIAATGKPLHVITDVPVRAGTMTSLPDIVLAESVQDPVVTGLALGTVAAGLEHEAVASVAAFQIIDQLCVQVNRTNVDADDGRYALDLPAEPPKMALFDAESLSFSDPAMPAGAPGAPTFMLQAVVTGDQFAGGSIKQLRSIEPDAVGQAVRVDFDLTGQQE